MKNDIFSNNPTEEQSELKLKLAEHAAELQQLKHENQDLRQRLLFDEVHQTGSVPSLDVAELNALVKGSLVPLLAGIAGLGQLGELGKLGQLGNLGGLGQLPQLEQLTNAIAQLAVQQRAANPVSYAHCGYWSNGYGGSNYVV
jgi:hypothetical protein